MIQEIGNNKFDNAYQEAAPKKEDYVILIDHKSQEALFNETMEFYTVGELEERQLIGERDVEYLFSVNDVACFVVWGLEIEKLVDAVRVPMFDMRGFQPRWMAFSVITAKQIVAFRQKNRFCGCCGSKMKKSNIERACICTSCSNIVYPKLSPAVIVAVTSGDNLLLTKYAKQASTYQKYALVAGFVEVGETLEDAVKREVMEEVGLKVTNVTYYKNQPWAFSESLLVGFFAEVEGSEIVSLDENELAEATWFPRAVIPCEDTTKASLTQEMITVFREGRN